METGIDTEETTACPGENSFVGPAKRKTESDCFLDLMQGDILESSHLYLSEMGTTVGLKENSLKVTNENAAGRIAASLFGSHHEGPATTTKKTAKRVRFETEADENKINTLPSNHEYWSWLSPFEDFEPKIPLSLHDEGKGSEAGAGNFSQLPIALTTNSFTDSPNHIDSEFVSSGSAKTRQIAIVEPLPAFFLDAVTQGETHRTRSGLIRYVGVEQAGWETVGITENISVYHQFEAASETPESRHFTTGWAYLESRVDDPSIFRLVVTNHTMAPRVFLMAIVTGMQVDMSSMTTLMVRVSNFTAGERCELVTFEGVPEAMKTLKTYLQEFSTLQV